MVAAAKNGMARGNMLHHQQGAACASRKCVHKNLDALETTIGARIPCCEAANSAGCPTDSSWGTTTAIRRNFDTLQVTPLVAATRQLRAVELVEEAAAQGWFLGAQLIKAGHPHGGPQAVAAAP
ncbi:hypothetical protein HPB50_027909 [Hyalomma asiaticum]|nr:hypothetical protein HPB50_027909 [Hyalomma asiaticum]